MNQPMAINWIGANSPDSVIVEMSCLQLNTPKGANCKSGFTFLVNDNGSYSIPWSVIGQFNPTCTLSITLHRYSANEFINGGKRIVVILQAIRCFEAYDFPGIH